jgi:hypothetical protein
MANEEAHDNAMMERLGSLTGFGSSQISAGGGGDFGQSMNKMGGSKVTIPSKVFSGI